MEKIRRRLTCDRRYLEKTETTMYSMVCALIVAKLVIDLAIPVVQQGKLRCLSHRFIK